MSEPVLTALILAPVILGIVASAVVWRRVVRPGLYFVISIFALLGLQAALAPIAIASLLAPGPTADAAFARSVAVGAAGVVLLGVPLLWWLYKGLRRA